MGPLSAFFVFTEYARRSLMLRVVDAKRAWRCVVLKARVRSSGSFIYSISPDPSRRRVRLRQRVDGSDGICDLFTATAYLNEPLRVRPCGSIFFLLYAAGLGVVRWWKENTGAPSADFFAHISSY